MGLQAFYEKEVCLAYILCKRYQARLIMKNSMFFFNYLVGSCDNTLNFECHDVPKDKTTPILFCGYS